MEGERFERQPVNNQVILSRFGAALAAFVSFRPRWTSLPGEKFPPPVKSPGAAPGLPALGHLLACSPFVLLTRRARPC